MQSYFSMLTWCIPQKTLPGLASFLRSHFVIGSVPLIGPPRTILSHYIFSISLLGLSLVSLKEVIMTGPQGTHQRLTKHHYWLSFTEVDRETWHFVCVCTHVWVCVRGGQHMCAAYVYTHVCLTNSTSFLIAHQWQAPVRTEKSLTLSFSLPRTLSLSPSLFPLNWGCLFRDDSVIGLFARTTNERNSCWHCTVV